LERADFFDKLFFIIEVEISQNDIEENDVEKDHEDDEI